MRTEPTPRDPTPTDPTPTESAVTEPVPLKPLEAATRELWRVSERVPPDRLPSSDEFNDLQGALGQAVQRSHERHARDGGEQAT